MSRAACSHFSEHHNHLQACKLWAVVPTPEHPIKKVWGWGPQICTSKQLPGDVLLLVQGPHLEHP